MLAIAGQPQKALAVIYTCTISYLSRAGRSLPLLAFHPASNHIVFLPFPAIKIKFWEHEMCYIILSKCSVDTYDYKSCAYFILQVLQNIDFHTYFVISSKFVTKLHTSAPDQSIYANQLGWELISIEELSEPNFNKDNFRSKFKPGHQSRRNDVILWSGPLLYFHLDNFSLLFPQTCNFSLPRASSKLHQQEMTSTNWKILVLQNLRSNQFGCCTYLSERSFFELVDSLFDVWDVSFPITLWISGNKDQPCTESRSKI